MKKNLRIKEEAKQIINWICKYLANNESYKVLPDIKPKSVYNSLEKSAPLQGQALDNIFEEFKKNILPGITHWNHPKFFAYFNSSSTMPAVFAELIRSAINTNSMLWKASPGATEVEEKTLEWFAQLVGLTKLKGISYEGGAIASFHALAAMREEKIGSEYRKKGLMGVKNVSPAIYLTSQTHNSIHKALFALGFGADNFRFVDTKADFSMDTKALCKMIKKDKKNNNKPVCVVATLGTTSCTAIDPIKKIVNICEKNNLFLHVDAAHGGSAAILKKVRKKYKGWEKADSILINPHKWFFVPIGLSVLYMKSPELFKKTFHYSAEYLKTDFDGKIINYMDYGLPLGRCFRCLKLWFSLKYYGVDFFKTIIKNHLRYAKSVYSFFEKSEDFEIMAPKPLSTVCFRAIPRNSQDIDSFNKELMQKINSTGKFFLSHTKLNSKFVLRHVISGFHTKEKHIKQFIKHLIRLKAKMDKQVVS